jgi:hypothetical protein
MLHPGNVTNIQNYKVAGDGFAVYVYGVGICVYDIELLCSEDIFPVLCF